MLAKQAAYSCAAPLFFPIFLKVGKNSHQGTSNRAALPPGKNAFEASHIFTRSVAHLYTLCVYRAAPRRPVFFSAFSKAGEMFPKRNGFILFASTKRTKSSRRAAALSTPGDGSKLYRLYFFVTFLAFVPKQAYGATHFFGCFEPVRKGCCSADARLMFFENRMLYSKLTRRNVFKKGSCSLSLLRWEFEIMVC